MTQGGLMRIEFKRRLALLRLRFQLPVAPKFECPVCQYTGPFLPFTATIGPRQHAMCARCGSLERHRLQWLALTTISKQVDFSKMRVLHFAPEAFLGKKFAGMFRSYATADIDPRGVDYMIDLTKPLPFAARSFDLVYASHVLEHIADDRAALENIRRVLAPNGIAVLPVPIVAKRTIEYPEPNPFEVGHVRAPGLDYYRRYEPFFRKITIFVSEDFSENFQTFIYEDRSHWPTPEMPLREPMGGIRHPDAVPICYL